MDGYCRGVCSPGTTQCAGNVLQACTVYGHWDPVSACDGGGCDGGTVACVPDAGSD
jgi:hypothetical protein